MRGGGLRAGLGAADLGDDDRLASLARGGQRAAQLVAVAAAFHVRHDDSRVVVAGQPFDAVRHIDIGLVAGADPVRQT
ncbi:hypothetical protein D3C71_2028820 [compost metagenome]